MRLLVLVCICSLSIVAVDHIHAADEQKKQKAIACNGKGVAAYHNGLWDMAQHYWELAETLGNCDAKINLALLKERRQKLK